MNKYSENPMKRNRPSPDSGEKRRICREPRMGFSRQMAPLTQLLDIYGCGVKTVRKETLAPAGTVASKPTMLTVGSGVS